MGLVRDLFSPVHYHYGANTTKGNFQGKQIWRLISPCCDISKLDGWSRLYTPRFSNWQRDLHQTFPWVCLKGGWRMACQFCSCLITIFDKRVTHRLSAYLSRIARGIWRVDDFIGLIDLSYPYSKVHGANMEPTLALSAPDGPHLSPMNLAIRVCYLIGMWNNIAQFAKTARLWPS